MPEPTRDVVQVAAEAGRDEPLIVLEPLRDLLDAHGLGAGELSAEPIGQGHSNVTYLVRRGRERFVLRRPPRGPLAPSANDVLREARLLSVLRLLGLPVAEVLLSCEDSDVIGAPFYVMAFVEGRVLVGSVPPAYGGGAGEQIAGQMVRTLAAVHAVDASAPTLASFGRPSGYLERQLRRFGGLLEHNATRPLPDLEKVGAWLADNLPPSPSTTVVHGDFRLGNIMFAPTLPQVQVVLDWEMATLGDPLADLGYCTAMWAEHDDPPNPMLDLSQVTRTPGFPPRGRLVERYAELSGLDLSALPWYQVLALWKAAIFLEGSYGRYRSGASGDDYFARLEHGVPLLAELALSLARRA